MRHANFYGGQDTQDIEWEATCEGRETSTQEGAIESSMRQLTWTNGSRLLHGESSVEDILGQSTVFRVSPQRTHLQMTCTLFAGDDGVNSDELVSDAAGFAFIDLDSGDIQKVYWFNSCGGGYAESSWVEERHELGGWRSQSNHSTNLALILTPIEKGAMCHVQLDHCTAEGVFLKKYGEGLVRIQPSWGVATVVRIYGTSTALIVNHSERTRGSKFRTVPDHT
jgi:hypothetical protein